MLIYIVEYIELFNIKNTPPQFSSKIWEFDKFTIKVFNA